jgi:hypothetical protein
MQLHRKTIGLFLTLISILGYGFIVFAATPPTGGYAPGTQLDPECDPNDLVYDCFVTPPNSLAIGNPVTGGSNGQILYTNSSGNLAGDNGFKRNASTFETSIDTHNSTFSTGDVLSLGNDTVLSVNDATQAITFSYGGSSYTFPIGDGTATQFLATDGNGQLAWTDPFVAVDVANNNVFTPTIGGGTSFTTAQGNIVFGLNAGHSITSAGDTIAIGSHAGESGTTIGANVLIGNQAGQQLTGGNSVMIGYAAGSVTTSPYSNVMIGFLAGNSNINGSNNMFLGALAGQDNISGSFNVALGDTAGDNSITGSQNTFLGSFSRVDTDGWGSSIALGYDAMITASNQMVIGSGTAGISDLYIGQGVRAASGGAGTNITIHATGGGDTIADKPGGKLILAGGKSTGNAIGGSIVFQTSDVTGSGTTVQNLSTKMEIESDGGIFMNSLASGTGGGSYDALCINDATHEVTVNTGGNDCVVSSQRFKDNIADSDLGLSFVKSLTPRMFTYKDTGDRRIGFIAEEVAAIDPRLVFYENDGVTVRGVRYQDMTSALAKAVQELDLKITTIQNTANSFQNQTFYDSLIEWIGSSINKITRIHVDQELCIGATCINESDLQSFKAWQASQVVVPVIPLADPVINNDPVPNEDPVPVPEIVPENPQPETP